ncbi:MAG: hypothetical protein WAL61_02615 [Acidimicrobiales bacterium]
MAEQDPDAPVLGDSTRSLLTVTCPVTGQSVEVPSATPSELWAGFSFECPCGRRHPIFSGFSTKGGS